MKYIKTFEKRNEPEIGDYILLNDKDKKLVSFSSSFRDFINNTIGNINDIDGVNKYMCIRYDYVPDNIKGYFDNDIGNFYYRWICTDDYVYTYAKTKEELELKIAAKKYNI